MIPQATTLQADQHDDSISILPVFVEQSASEKLLLKPSWFVVALTLKGRLCLQLQHCYVRDQLVELGMRRKMAAIIVRAFFDHWVEALSKVEHQGRSMLFATADLGGKRMWTAFGSEDKFSAFQELLPEDEPPKRLYTVKLGEIMDGIRHRAQKADIHLGSFFLPPEHPFFIKCTTEFRAAREKALNQFDPLRKPPRGPSERERQAFEDTLCTI